MKRFILRTLLLCTTTISGNQSMSWVERCMNQAIETWTMLDLTQSIAQEDQHYLYQDLMKSELDLYAMVYGCAQERHEMKNLEEANTIFNALIAAYHNAFGNKSQKLAQELCIEMILKETLTLWDTIIAHLPAPTDIKS